MYVDTTVPEDKFHKLLAARLKRAGSGHLLLAFYDFPAIST
jgi:hypothetical protein